MSTATATALETVTPLVKDWCAAHADRIQACYLHDGPKDMVTMILVGRYEPFDDILADAVDEFADVVLRSSAVFVLVRQTGPGTEDELLGVYPVKQSVRIFGE